MQHMMITCEAHPDLEWSAKAIAINRNGRYNGCRNIFFIGHKDHGAYNGETGEVYRECECPGSGLIARDLDAVNHWHDSESGPP
jgi:hypothetical protein